MPFTDFKAQKQRPLIMCSILGIGDSGKSWTAKWLDKSFLPGLLETYRPESPIEPDMHCTVAVFLYDSLG